MTADLDQPPALDPVPKADLQLPIQEVAPLSARPLTLIDGARIYDPHYRLRDQLGVRYNLAVLDGRTTAHVDYVGNGAFRITVPIVEGPGKPGWTLVAVTSRTQMQALLNDTCPMTGCQVTLTTADHAAEVDGPTAHATVAGFGQQGLRVQVTFDGDGNLPGQDIALIALDLIAFLATSAAAFLAAHRLVGSPWQDLRA